MIQVQSLLNIADNSGYKLGRCIKVIKKKCGLCGDLILISIQKIKNKKKTKLKIQKGEITHAVILRNKSKFQRKNSNFIKFNENAASPVNKQFRPIGTRIFGPVLRELRKSKFMKIASLSKGFV
jgi:large subunit ribosomal protein L14